MAHDLSTRLQTLKADLTSRLTAATTLDELESVRISFLGRNGIIVEFMSILKELSVEEKRVAGPLINDFKKEAQELYEQRKKEVEALIQAQSRDAHQHFDITADPHTKIPGSLHVYTHIIQQLEDIFISMGYTIADGPEVDSDYYNFGALNIPQDHPARDMYDTFWLDVPGLLLRTHTSSVQAHVMKNNQPPLAVFVPGRCYRNEAVDASHDFMFTQAEGIFIDKNVSLSNLLATAQSFLQAIFQTNDLEIRVRPGFFPFVEPGVEIDASCPFCKGSGCSTCKKTGWIEIMGAGLIHPNVLRASGIDPDVYSGFAFGTGIERLAMIKYGIKDIRLFHGSNIRFLEQF